MGVFWYPLVRYRAARAAKNDNEFKEKEDFNLTDLVPELELFRKMHKIQYLRNGKRSAGGKMI